VDRERLVRRAGALEPDKLDEVLARLGEMFAV